MPDRDPSLASLPSIEVPSSNSSNEFDVLDEYVEISKPGLLTTEQLLARLPKRLRVACTKIYENESPHRNISVRDAKGDPVLFKAGFEALKELSDNERMALVHTLLSGIFESREERRLRAAIIWQLGDYSDEGYRKFVIAAALSEQKANRSPQLLAHAISQFETLPEGDELWQAARQTNDRMLKYALVSHASFEQVDFFAKDEDLLSGLIKSADPKSLPLHLKTLIGRKLINKFQAIDFLFDATNRTKSNEPLKAALIHISTLPESQLLPWLKKIQGWVGEYSTMGYGYGLSGPDSILGSGPADRVYTSILRFKELEKFHLSRGDEEIVVLKTLQTIQQNSSAATVQLAICDIISHWYLRTEKNNGDPDALPYDKKKHIFYSDPGFVGSQSTRLALVRELSKSADKSLSYRYSEILKFMAR